MLMHGWNAFVVVVIALGAMALVIGHGVATVWAVAS